jgi:acetyl esterase
MKSAQMFLGILLFCGSANAQAEAGPASPDILLYKTVGAAKLIAHIFHPSQASDGKRAPAILLIHGGGWVPGSPEWG